MSKVETFFVYFKAEIAFVYKWHTWQNAVIEWRTVWSADFRNSTKVSNSLDQDQARLFVGPDLGPTCLQRLSAAELGPHCLPTLANICSRRLEQITFSEAFFRSRFKGQRNLTKLKRFDIVTRLLKISIWQTGVHVAQSRCIGWNKLLLYSWPWSRASKVFDARRLIEVDVCEGEEVTKISLVPLDSCAYTSEE